jgi:hypothetical protein
MRSSSRMLSSSSMTSMVAAMIRLLVLVARLERATYGLTGT